MPTGVYIRTENHKRKISEGNRGVKCSEETRRKISEGNRGRIVSKKTKRKISESLKGYKQSEEHKRKNSESKKGEKCYLFGKKLDTETRKRMSEARRGSKSHFWKGGVTPLNKEIRNSLEYKLWREAVFERDNWTCVWCHMRGVELNADHIKPFAFYPELRFAIDNGRTLCVPCHKTTETHSNSKKVEN